MAVALAACRFVSLGKEIYIAGVFGARVVMDAYALAVLVPAIGMTLLVNPIRRAFQTQYAGHEASSSDGATRFANLFLTNLLIASLVAAVGVASLLDVVWPIILGSSGSPEVVAALQRLAWPTGLLLVPMTIVSGLMSVLHVRYRFAKPQLTHVVPTLTVVAFVMARPDWGAGALLWGLFCGLIVQCSLLLGMVIRSGHRPRFVFNPLSQAGKRLLRVGISLAVIDGLVQANVFVDRWMAGSLEEGRISVLYWSGLMKDFFTITLLASLMSVLIPHFSRQVAENEIDELRRSCALVLRYGAMLMFPLSTLIAVCGPVFLSQLQLGALTSEDAGAIGWCLAAYSLGLFAELVGPILSQVLVAFGRLRVMLLISIGASFLPNLVLNYLLIGPLGEVGLALSTALVACVSMTCMYLTVRHTVGIHEETLGFRTIAGSLGAALVTAAVGYAVLQMVRSMVPNESWTQLAAGSAAACAQVTIYVALMFGYPGSNDARHALSVLQEKLREFLS